MSLSRPRWQRMIAVRWLLCLALGLAGAQVLALAHGLSHLAESTQTDPRDDPGHVGTAGSPCGLCLVGFAAAGPGLSGSALTATSPAPTIHGESTDAAHMAPGPGQLAYRSQAPPLHS